MHRLLVLRGGALGDFIVTLPTLVALRARWPQARIELVGNRTAAEIALNRGWLDAIHSQHEARWATLFSGEPLPPDFAAWLATFDLVLSYWPDADRQLASRFPLHPGQRFLSASAQPTQPPAAAHYAEPLHLLGIAVAPLHRWVGLSPQTLFDRAEIVSPSDNDRGGGHTTLSPSGLIAVHPGSGSATKNWPLARWLELCRWLRHDQAAELLVVMGEVESTATREAFSAVGRAAYDFSLEALITAFASCRLFIGHDSGISHLAAACGVPSVLLFGPTRPEMWAPPAPHVCVVQTGDSLEEISVADVQSVLVLRLRATG